MSLYFEITRALPHPFVWMAARGGFVYKLRTSDELAKLPFLKFYYWFMRWDYRKLAPAKVPAVVDALDTLIEFLEDEEPYQRAGVEDKRVMLKDRAEVARKELSFRKE